MKETYIKVQESISHEKLLAQVELICLSPSFQRSEKLSSFLKFIIYQHLNGKGELIKAYTIALEVFDRSENFDPQKDSIVRVYGGRLRKALENYYIQKGREDDIIIRLPKGRYIPLIRRRDDMLNVETEIKKPTIALIIFDCLNEKERFNYLANGLSEEIVIGLGKFKELKVIGPLKREYQHEIGLDVQGIGKKYDAKFLLEGTLRIKENVLRLTVRLTETNSLEQLWGNVIECDTVNGSISKFENLIVRNTVSTLADNYGVISRSIWKDISTHSKEKPTTYEAILRYYNHFIVLTPQSQTEATLALENALANEPKNPLIMAMLGDLMASSFLFGNSDSITSLQRAKDLARRSIALDPNCQAGHFSLGLVYFLEGEKRMCVMEFESALKLNPNNAHYIASISLFLAMAGDWEYGIDLMDRACEMNPHYPGWHHLVYFMNYYRLSQFEEALIHANKFNTSDFYWDPLIRAAVLSQLDEKKEMKEALYQLMSLVPDFKQRGRSMIRRFAFSDSNVDLLWDGLRKAGIDKI